jgi:hypothetical protein
MAKQVWLTGAVLSCWTIVPAQQPQPPIKHLGPSIKEFRLTTSGTALGIAVGQDGAL